MLLLLLGIMSIITKTRPSYTRTQPLLKGQFQLLASRKPGAMRNLALLLVLFVTRYAAYIK